MVSRCGAQPPIIDQLDGKRDQALVAVLLEGLALGQVGVCLCDEQDNVRYCNATFRSALFPDLPDTPVNFVDAITSAIAGGKGIRLVSMSLDTFVPRIKERRRNCSEHLDFTLDLIDGSWWQISDRRLPNGWILVTANDISSIKQEEFRLRREHASAVKAAQTDSLTGLDNRRHGMERAEAALTAFEGSNIPLTIALLDIDHFKQINDVHGHDVGDDVLVHFAQALLNQLAPQDQVSRIGGEEFLVVMPETRQSQAEHRLHHVLRNLAPLQTRSCSHLLCFSFSAGVASAVRSESLKSLLGRADSALYTAKSKGRQRIEIARKTASEAA